MANRAVPPAVWHKRLHEMAGGFSGTEAPEAHRQLHAIALLALRMQQLAESCLTITQRTSTAYRRGAMMMANEQSVSFAQAGVRP